MLKVKALRSFNRTPQGGGLVEIGETIEVDDTRAGELARLGLAEPVKAPAKEKAAPEPDNKMAPAPDNKEAQPVRVRRVKQG